jgi:HrpA-like RNA helicase
MEDVYIICTQPRRIAAMNIARRVALELGERVGELVGYQVGMESRVSPRTRIVFMTTGIFLMRLVNNPDSFEKITHIIMDEVHERDLDIDFSLVVLKHLLAKIMNEGTDATGLKFKLLLMSATFNTDLFKNYYSKKGIAEIEKDIAYLGVKEKYEKEAAEKKRKMEEAWGGASKNKKNVIDWNVQPKLEMEDSDEWVENNLKPDEFKFKNSLDPSEVVRIDARPFNVKSFHIDEIIRNLKDPKHFKG